MKRTLWLFLYKINIDALLIIDAYSALVERQ